MKKLNKKDLKNLILREAKGISTQNKTKKEAAGGREFLRKLILKEAKKMGIIDAPKKAWPTPTSKTNDVANQAEFSKMKVDKEAAKLVSHSCANHVLMESESDLKRIGVNESNSLGKCVWHTLNESGNISHYDVKFGKKVVKNIPAQKLIVISESNHMHETRPKRKGKK